MAAQDVDFVAERSFGFLQKFCRIGSSTHCLCADGTHTFGRQVTQSFAKARKRAECSCLCFGCERTSFVKTACEANGFFPVALRRNAVAMHLTDFHAEAVASQINGT